MSHQYFKKVSSAVAGLVLSVLLAVLAEGLMSMNTPGAYVNFVLFPPGASDGSYNLGLVLFVHIGVDSLLCFALLSGGYLLFTRLSNRHGK